MKPKISIVIACYNDINIVDAVISAANQKYPDKEIIVVNDGSNQETVAAIESVKAHIDIFLDQSNQGQSIARNNGIKKASGELILNLDSDDSFEPDFCTKAVDQFELDPYIKIVTCYARRFTGKKTIDIFKPQGGEINDFLFSNAALGSSMFRKSDWEYCGGYEEVLPILGFEDWDLYLNILKNGGQAFVIPEVLFNYHIREGSTTDRIRDFKHDKFHQIILKHKELYISNFDELVANLINRLKNSDVEKERLLNKPDMKLGEKILKPFRVIKAFFK